jgi:hypothetical protein
MTPTRWIIRAALVVLFWSCVVIWFCVSSGCAPLRGSPSVSCHPGQHRCQTDAECEDEEAYFLDVEEGGQR